jgi:pantetheine-phosphate adenylyltransferase
MHYSLYRLVIFVKTIFILYLPRPSSFKVDHKAQNTILCHMLKVVYPGSFDPPTFGHLNIIERASRLFDELHVVIAVNKDKKHLFNSDERLKLMQSIVPEANNIEVDLWDGLTVDYAKKINAKVLIRGVRAIDDFGHEFELAMVNRGLDQAIETLFMPTDPKYFYLRSSMIKELLLLGGDIAEMVPINVEKALRDKLLGA